MSSQFPATLPRLPELELRAIFESITDYAIFTTDPAGMVTSWSAGAERLFGYSAEEILGHSGDSLWTAEDLAAGVPDLERDKAAAVGFAEDTRWHQAKGDRKVFVIGTMRPLRETGGPVEAFVKICRDITLQRSGEDAAAELRAQTMAAVESERAQLADAFKRSPSFVAILRGPEHRFQLANDRYRDLVGGRELIGRTVREALPEVIEQGFLEILDRVYRTGQQYVGRNISVRLRREAGDALEKRILDFVYQATRDPDGSIAGVFVHGMDVTAHKEVEAKLKNLTQHQLLALNAANMGWWRLTPSTGWVSVDARAQQIYGITKTELPSEEILARIMPDDVSRVRSAIEQIINSPEPEHYAVEYRLRHEDGQIRWISSRGAPRMEDGRVVALVGTVADITDKVNAEHALRESETRFRQLADAMPQIVFAATADGHVDYFNRQWYEYTGISEGDVGYESWKQVHLEDKVSDVLQKWTNAVESGSPYQTEYPLRRADGIFRWHLGRALPVRDARGKIIRWFGTNTDVDDYKRLQRQHEILLESERAARAEAERTSRIKDEFLATLSHELRTPLNAILGWAQVLRGREGNLQELEKGLATIERNARAQTKIIEDLLDMSAIISGKVRLDASPLELSKVVEAAVETVRPTAGTKGVHVEFPKDAESLTVIADSNRLQQVFWNLLSNAIKFTPRHGTIRVSMKCVRSHAEVQVADSGCGIPPEFLPFVFDRFRQADASTTRRHGGLGLGLAIVKQLVELHGGSITIHSEGSGRGTTCVVSLPLAPLARSSKLPDQKEDHSLEQATVHPVLNRLRLDGLRVLIVDDEPDARSLLGHLLEERGAAVFLADSAAAAFELLAREHPDLLISDIGMPGEDGYSLMRRIRCLPDGGSIPAIALTAYARPDDRTRALLAGFQMHAAKPVDATELLVMVASLGERHVG